MSISIVIVLFAVSTSETVNDALSYEELLAVNLTTLFAATIPVPNAFIFATPSFNLLVCILVSTTLVGVDSSCDTEVGITILPSFI